MPQGSILGTLLLLMYINNLSKAIIISAVDQFADDTKILNIISYNLVQWLRTNKIFVNVSKTKIVTFMSHSKQITKHLNFHLSGQKIIPKHHAKHLRILIDEYLTFKEYMGQLKGRS